MCGKGTARRLLQENIHPHFGKLNSNQASHMYVPPMASMDAMRSAMAVGRSCRGRISVGLRKSRDRAGGITLGYKFITAFPEHPISTRAGRGRCVGRRGLAWPLPVLNRFPQRTNPMSVVAADDDVFADGTPASGKPFPVDDVPVKAFLRAASAVPEPKKVSPNPTAAEVQAHALHILLVLIFVLQIHMKEAGAPWRAKYEQRECQAWISVEFAPFTLIFPQRLRPIIV